MKQHKPGPHTGGSVPNHEESEKRGGRGREREGKDKYCCPKHTQLSLPMINGEW